MKYLLVLSGFMMAYALIQEDTGKNWEEILGPSKAEIPPLPVTQLTSKVSWWPELQPAIDEARSSGKPLFVSMRCLPCKQCSNFDRDVLEGGPELTPLLQQFVCVRLTAMDAMDLRIFPIQDYQDLDLSWWGWYLSAELEIYGVFGGRDHISDTSRISVPALGASCQRVLEHHYDPRRRSWKIDGPAAKLEGEVINVKKLPGYASWISTAWPEEKAQNCIHCHQAADILRQPAIDAGEFNKQTDFFVWPYPENIGLLLDRNNGLTVRDVTVESPAWNAGVRKGDLIAAAGERKLFSQADLQGVLHRSPAAETRLMIRWFRNGEYRQGEIHLQMGWKAVDLSWRKSVAEGRVGAHPGFHWPLGISRELRHKLKIQDGQMGIRPWMGKDPCLQLACKAGLTPSDVIIAVNGYSMDLTGRAFLVWFRLTFEKGDPIVLELVNERGQRREIQYILK